MPANRLPACATAVALLLALPVPAAEPDGIAEYHAEYEVRYNGRHVANAEFSVTTEAAGQYLFASSTQARGLLKLASPNPAIERSRFRVVAGRLSPSDFAYEDGSRKGEDNYSLDFDAAHSEIRISRADGASSLPLQADLLDRGSLQVALMRDLASCALPDSYRFVDEDGIRRYDYERLDDQAAETGLGTLHTVRLQQQRAGSSRRTILWLAPDYAYLPVRIEQIRDGEIETVFSLVDLDGLAPTPSACSGFR